MTDLTALREKRKTYIKEQAQMIVDRMVKREVTTDTLATCGKPGFGWDNELHNAMPEISRELSEMGVRTTSSVNWEVTDWVFMIQI